MRILSSQSRVMNDQAGSIDGVDDGEVEVEVLGDRGPVVDAGSAQGVGADLDVGAADDVEVDDRFEVFGVVGDEVEVLGVLQVEGPLEAGAWDLLPPGLEIGVRAIGDPRRRL